MNTGKLPNTLGISLKAQHYQDIIETKPNIGWFEVHPENYMGAGGLPHYFLNTIHRDYPLSMHGVGLSLGSADGIDPTHLSALAATVSRHQPEQVSEHLAWSHWNSVFLNDLLPLPYTQEFLTLTAANIQRVQEKLQQRILVENPSAYIGFAEADYSETEFLTELVRQTGCGLLLDVNNVFVSANNQGFDATDYINNYPLEQVGEIHLAGHTHNQIDDTVVLIDDHGSPVIDAVWALFANTLEKLQRPVPVLIEWDTDVPALSTLLDEATKAQQIMDRVLLQEAG